MSGPLLTGQIAKAIYAGFKGKLLTGQLRQQSAGGLDEYGDPTPGTVTLSPMQGFTDEYDDAYRARAGIPETDLIVNIFAQSLPAGIRPGKDDKAQFLGQWYQIRAVKTDPATALWTCQAFRIEAPAP
ncbi:hypothetical protein GCM10011491_30930 [Brucella endophytica]|uniref:Uncharacterized protein n=1 Tax=Brucella endophytica TaxID=1963359 RepID=A0A916SI49_9HYPH|nr:hypothetical protein [Brucella endophytica]GGB00540.1 hypothetical protein GCM10011491_30930 [Brucella endophytica]